ncbi:TolC family protein [Hufsiella ginkgonis]|uniref:TolC family protein n=1 Tax=Hufsiella ginkgonis TaxID=2695274 RepID=A0A7K1XYW3_9SPHI|nr:TolC family protein [Hufsiella ginkgonis]MXV16181.1 TolC family protein [Hufsiella ginkgonis]
MRHRQLFIPALLLVFVIIIFPAKAQDSMIGDISYVYLEKLITIAKENYPRMKSVQSRVDIARINVTKQSVAWLDPLTVSFIYAPNYTFNIVDPTYFDGIQLGLSVNIGSILQKPFNVKQAKREVEIARADLAEYNMTLEAEVRRRYFTYIQLLNLLKVQSKSLVDAQSVAEQVRLRYEKSEVTFDVYSQAMVALGSARSARISAESSMLIAKVSLEELVTRKLEEIK